MRLLIAVVLGAFVTASAGAWSGFNIPAPWVGDNLLAPAHFDRDAERHRVELMTLRADGFSILRIELDLRAGAPGSILDASGEVDADVLDSLAGFIRMAGQQQIRLVVCAGPLPPKGASSPGPWNAAFLDPAEVDRNRRFLTGLVRGLHDRAAMPDAMDLVRSGFFAAEGPFAQSAGTFSAPNGVTYDLATERELLAREMAVWWVGEMAAAARSATSAVQLWVSLPTTPHSPGVPDGSSAAFPWAPDALATSPVQTLAFQISPSSQSEWHETIRAIRLKDLEHLAAEHGKSIVIGALGLPHNQSGDQQRAARWIARLRDNVELEGFAGMLFWAWPEAADWLPPTDYVYRSLRPAK